VSVSPAADIEGLADAAMNGQLTTAQKLALQAYLASLKREYPDFALDDYRRGMVRDQWDVFSACQGPATTERTKLADRLGADDLRPTSPAPPRHCGDTFRRPTFHRDRPLRRCWWWTAIGTR